VRAVQTEDIDGCAGVILGVMGAVGRMIDHVPPDARARLATIIGELLNPAPESKRTGAFREPRILALADGRFDQQNSIYTSNDADLADEGAGALLRLLVRVRNKVTINHGSKGLSEATEQVLTRQVLDGLAQVPGLHPVGPADTTDRLGVVAFSIEGVHPHDVGQVLDAAGVAVRTGHHCAQPIHQHFGVHASSRLSFGACSTPEEVDRFLSAIADVRRYFQR